MITANRSDDPGGPHGITTDGATVFRIGNRILLAVPATR